MNKRLLQKALGLLLGAIMIIAMMPINSFAADVPTMALDPADVETFPATSYKEIKDTSADDEIGIIVKKTAWKKYDGKRITIPDEINGKKVVALGHPDAYRSNSISGGPDGYATCFINNVTLYNDGSSTNEARKMGIYFPDASQAKHLKLIAPYAFYGHLDDGTLEIKDMPNLTIIGNSAFAATRTEVLELENLPKLEKIDDKAFSDSKIKEFAPKNLPTLKTIEHRAFYSEVLTSFDLRGVPNLEEIGSEAFYRIKSGSKDQTEVDIRYLTKLRSLSEYAFNVQLFPLQPLLIRDPQTGFDKEYFMTHGSDKVALHRLTFEFTTPDKGGNLPAALMEKQPKPCGLYPGLFGATAELKFDPNVTEPFDKFTDPETGNEWKFEGWTTTDQFVKTTHYYEAEGWTKNKTLHPVKYTGSWRLLFNKEKLKEALDNAKAKKKDVVVSVDGSDQPFTKQWVTESDKNTFDAAISTAQGVFDNKEIAGNTYEERQKVIDDATEALKKAIDAYNPQEGKVTFDKDPTYDQPKGAHKVTFVKGSGIESLNDESTFFYVKDNTALPADQFPVATASAGFGTKIFWDPAQDKVIKSDQAFTATAKAVDKAALQDKITEAEGLLQKDSTSDPAVALKTKVDEAKALIAAVDAGTERNQDTVDAKVTELEAAIQALKDLNAKKEAAKTEIADMDGLSDEEKMKLKDEVDKAKNEEAINEIKGKAEQQAQDNNALKEATAAVEKAEREKTKDAYDAAKTKVDALANGDSKTALEGRLEEVDKYVKADEALDALEAKKISEIKDSDLTDAEALIEKVKDEWKKPLTDRLNNLKEKKTADDILAAAEKAVSDLEKPGADVTDEKINDAQDKVDKVQDEDKKNALQDRLDKVKEDKEKRDAEKAAEDAAEKAVSDLEKPGADVTDEKINDAQGKVDKVQDEDKKKDLQDRLDKVKEDKEKKEEADKLAKAKEDAKKTINALENLTDDEKAPFLKQVDDATTIPEVEKAVLDAQKADAKKKVDGMNNLTDQDKQDAKDAIDDANNKGEVDKAVEDAQNKQDERQSLDDHKTDAKKKIDALDKLTPEEKDAYKGRIDQAQTKEEVDAIVLEAQKENAKRTVDGMNNLTDQDKKDAKGAIDNARNKGEIDKAVEDAQNKNDQAGRRQDNTDGRWIWPFAPQAPSKADEKKDTKRETVIKKAYIYGYEDGTFRPNGSMTRAEAAAMFARLANLNMNQGAAASFNDVSNHWAKASVNAMVSAGYMKGYPDGTFRPDGKITRAEFAQMIKAMDKANGAQAPFKDIQGHWAQAAIAQAYGNGRINGYPDGTFRPNNDITRAEAVTMFNNLYNRKVDARGLEQVQAQILDFKDLGRNNWAYFNIVAASNTAEVYYADKNKNDETWVRVIQNWKQAQANQ